jgi:hypothetical protein
MGCLLMPSRRSSQNAREPITCSAAVAGAQAQLPVLGHTVGSATVPNHGTVRVVFDDGSVLEVY